MDPVSVLLFMWSVLTITTSACVYVRNPVRTLYVFGAPVCQETQAVKGEWKGNHHHPFSSLLITNSCSV